MERKKKKINARTVWEGGCPIKRGKTARRGGGIVFWERDQSANTTGNCKKVSRISGRDKESGKYQVDELEGDPPESKAL